MPSPSFSNDRDSAALWQRFCALLWHDPDLGIWLDISRMALGEADLEALEPRFSAAFAAMEALEGGAIANADEHRQVGHYWLRNPSLAPDPQAGALISREIDRIESFGADLLAGRITTPAGTAFTDVL